jgi:uracil-DNA glycosylase family 4
MSDLNPLIDDTIQALESLKRTGVTHIEVSRKTLEELGKVAIDPLILASGQLAPNEVTRPKTDVAAEMEHLETDAKKCLKCAELSRCRHTVVFGVGNTAAEVMFIGEAPGADEDAQGEPFVGRAGQLLTKIIEAMGYTRDDVYITNIIKCRPPQNRTPLPDEAANCLPYVLRQIELIQPRVIVALGATALRALLDVQLGITKMRGHWYTFRDIPIMPTFHPAYLLRNPAAKREVWDDMKAVLDKLGRKPPKT